MKNRYIHIGYPKNLSTTLQRDFFNKHPEILHLGIGCGSNVDYIDEQTSIYMENFLVYANEFAYKKEESRILDHFNHWFKIGEENENIIAIGVSLELLSFRFTPDNVDTVAKAKRLLAIFGTGTKIIMIIRNQYDLLHSMYREIIRVGYAGTFQEYLRYLWVMQDRNHFHDFSYDNVFKLYKDLFGQENMLVIIHENIRNKNGKLKRIDNRIVLLDMLSSFLGCDYIEFELGHYNEAINSRQLATKRALNRIEKHDLGNEQYGIGANFHRLKNYLINELGQPDDKEYIYKDVLTKRRSLEFAKKNQNNFQPLEYDADPKLIINIMSYYKNSNERFVNLSGLQLPDNYTNLIK